MVKIKMPNDLKNLVEKQIDEAEVFKRILNEEEITKKIDTVFKFYRKPENKGKIYNDGFRDWVFIKTPSPEYEKNEAGELKLNEKGNKIIKNAPKLSKSTYDTDKKSFFWSCKFALGQLGVFVEKTVLVELKKIWNRNLLVTGRLRVQYRVAGSDIYAVSLVELAKMINKATVDDLTEEDYSIRYTLTLHQVISYE